MQRVLRIGHLSTVYHTAILLMARGDIEERLDIGVEWRLFGTGPAIVNAFERGELDLAYIGLPPAIIGMAKGVGIVCVAGGHMEGTVIAGEAELAGFPEVQDLGRILGQLRGKSIGVPGKGSIHDVIITDCLERFDLAKEIAVIHFPWADGALEAMVKKDVAAVVGTPALAVAVKTYAGGTILYPPSMLWPHNPSYGILVEKDFLYRETDLVEDFLILHEEATSFLRNSPWEAARVISDYIGFIDQEFVMDTLAVSPKYCAQLTDEFISSTMGFVEALRKLGYLQREVTSREIFDASMIRKIHPGKDHYGDGISDASRPALRKS
jgi:NitT/TauT family transport system substrate-binding protein